MSNHSDLSYQPSEAEQQPVANSESGPQPIDTGTPPQNVPTLPSTLPTVGQDDLAGDEDRTSLQLPLLLHSRMENMVAKTAL